MEQMFVLLEKMHEYFHLIMGKLGITLMSGKIVMLIVLVLGGIIVFKDLFGIIEDISRIISKKGKGFKNFLYLIAHVGAILAIAEAISKTENWILRFVKYLGIVDNAVVAEIFFLLIVAIGVGLFLRFCFRKLTEFTLSGKKAEEKVKLLEGQLKSRERKESELISKLEEKLKSLKEKEEELKSLKEKEEELKSLREKEERFKSLIKKLKDKLTEKHEMLFQKNNLTLHVFVREGHDTLYFELLSHQVTERSYVGDWTGSIEGRVDMNAAKVRIYRTNISSFDHMLVKISIPAGYFQVNFDPSDIKNEINHAGVFRDPYTIEEINEHFDKKSPEEVRKFIKDNNMAAKTEDSAKKWIERTFKKIMRGFGFEDIIYLKKYKVEVEFTSHTWKIRRGASQKEIGTVKAE